MVVQRAGGLEQLVRLGNLRRAQGEARSLDRSLCRKASNRQRGAKGCPATMPTYIWSMYVYGKAAVVLVMSLDGFL